MENRVEKRKEDSKVEQVFMVRPPHVNGYGRLFGGVLMQWIDETAGIVGRRHAEKLVTTASIDNLVFKSPAYQNDMIVLEGKLNYVGRTSMEVEVDTYIEDIHGMRRQINRAYVVMVAIDENGTPVPVPGLLIETDQDQWEWDNAEKRVELRKKRRQEGY
jgi:acyl-CoA hydrolase